MYLKSNPPLKDGSKLQSCLQRRERHILAVDLGPTCFGLAPFAADPLDQPTLLNGCKYRFARKCPKPEPLLVEELRKFVHSYVLQFDPIVEVDYEDYLQGTHYTAVKKQKFRELRADQRGVPCGVIYKSFGKAEFINVAGDFNDVLKNVRAINGPEDRWKVYSAHLIHAVEKQICQLKYFAKYIPVMERPRAIYERLSPLPGPYFVTDYTSFEASFSSEVLDAVEGTLYRHMLKGFSECEPIIKQMTGKHRCKFRDFVLTVPGTRMSGDPNTSLGNGFTNLMLMLFMCHKAGIVCEGFVEGDDGLFAFSGHPNFEVISKLGFDLKLEAHDTLYTTSFCGLLLSRSLACFAEPVYEIVKFGWSMSSQRFSGKHHVKMGLLRAKALSLFYCHPRCPMLTSLALKYVQLTQGYKPIFSNNYWEKKIVDETIKYDHEARLEYERGISHDDRVDFEELFGVSIATQIAFESYIAKIRSIGQLKHWSIDLICADRPFLHWMDSTHTILF